LKYLIKLPLQYGANEASEYDDPELPRYVRITDIDDRDNLRSDTFKSLQESQADGYILGEGDLLFARSGATVGKTFLYKGNWGRCAYAGYLIRAKLDINKVNPQYIKYFTTSSLYWSWLSANFIQATIQNVSAERYASLLFPIPVLSEQGEIVTHLDRETAKLDALVSNVERAVELLKEYRVALISAAVTGKIDLREEVP
jgi:type I restriction enzyme S subunit